MRIFDHIVFPDCGWRQTPSDYLDKIKGKHVGSDARDYANPCFDIAGDVNECE